MKKTLLIMALAVFGFANAQKGTILVAGKVGFAIQKRAESNNDNKSDTFVISPQVGYQFNDHWTLGALVSSGFNKNNATNVYGNFYNKSESKNSVLSIGPFLRYTKPLNEMFSVYADFSTGYRTSKSTQSTLNINGASTSTYKTNGFYTEITPAVFINVKKNFGLNFSFGGVGYSNSHGKNQIDYAPESKSTSNGIAFNFGQTFNVGVSKNF